MKKIQHFNTTNLIIIPIIQMFRPTELVLVACLFTASLSEYTLVQTIANISNNLSNVAITGDLNTLYIQNDTNTYFYIYTGSRYKIDSFLNWPHGGIVPTFNGTSAIVDASSIYVNRNYIQTIYYCYSSKIALDGAYYFGFIHQNDVITLYQRKSISSSFDIFSGNLTMLYSIYCIGVAENAKTMALVSRDKIYIYKNASTGFKIDDMLPHGFTNPSRLQMFNNRDLSLMIVVNQNTFNLFRLVDEDYELYQSLVFQDKPNKVSFDEDILAISFQYNTKIYKRTAADGRFQEYQTINQGFVDLTLKNKTLAAIDSSFVYIWKEIGAGGHLTIDS